MYGYIYRYTNVENRELVQESLRRQIAAINVLTAKGMKFWDYGNSLYVFPFICHSPKLLLPFLLLCVNHPLLSPFPSPSPSPSPFPFNFSSFPFPSSLSPLSPPLSSLPPSLSSSII